MPMKVRMPGRACLAVLAAALLQGCMWGRVQTNDPGIRGRAEAIRVGVTREADLRAILDGDPTVRMPVKDRTVLGYTYSDTKSHGLMLILFNFMKTQTVSATVYVELDAQGVVSRVTVPEERTVPWEFWPF